MLRTALFLFFLTCGTAAAQETSAFKPGELAGTWRIYFMTSKDSEQTVMYCNTRILSDGTLAQAVECPETIGEIGGGTTRHRLDSTELRLARNGRIKGSVYFGFGSIAEVRIIDAWMTKNGEAFHGIGKVLTTPYQRIYMISGVKR